MTLLDALSDNPIGSAWLIGYLSAAGAVIAAVWKVAFTWVRSLDGADTYQRCYLSDRTDPGPRLRASMLKLRRAR